MMIQYYYILFRGDGVFYERTTNAHPKCDDFHKLWLKKHFENQAKIDRVTENTVFVDPLIDNFHRPCKYWSFILDFPQTLGVSI